jgi:peptide chain release factor subunit 1
MSLTKKEVTMLNEKDLRELLEFSSPTPVLSIYLDTQPSEGNADAYKLRLRNMLKQVNLPQDISVIQHFFEHEFKPSGRGIAIFSCAAQNYFHYYPLAIPVVNFVSVSDRPTVKPLAHLLDSYGSYGVALVDKQGARLFYFNLGELREQEGVLGEAVHHTKRGGASAVPGRRGGTAGQTEYTEEVIDRNMKESADFAAHFFEENHVRRILIGGSDENVVLFRNSLPKAWQSLIMGTFPMSMTAGEGEILKQAMELGLKTEKQSEVKLVADLISADKKGTNAVLGMTRTLTAINQGRIQTLVISEGYRQPAYRCKGCGFLTLTPGQSCDACGGAFEKVEDGVELALGLTMRSGGAVEVVHKDSALQAEGNIGAFLRY